MSWEFDLRNGAKEGSFCTHPRWVGKAREGSDVLPATLDPLGESLSPLARGGPADLTALAVRRIQPAKPSVIFLPG